MAYGKYPIGLMLWNKSYFYKFPQVKEDQYSENTGIFHLMTSNKPIF